MAIESLYVPDLLGGLELVAEAGRLRNIYFEKRCAGDSPGPIVRQAEAQLREYFAGRRRVFDLPLDLRGTAFQLAVWRELEAIEFGGTRSYRDIAAAVGRPKGFQAIGQANTRNPIPIVIPCHRVINADASLGGYGGGIERKKILLELERTYVDTRRQTAA